MEKYKSLPAATVGLVFLGTPFRGTKLQFLADCAERLMRLSGSESHRGIIEELSFDKPALLDTLDSFCRLRNRLSTPVSCFNELQVTDYGKRHGLGGLVTEMVSEKGLGSLLLDQASTDTLSMRTI